MIRYELICKCNNCGEFFFIPTTEETYEKIVANEKISGAVTPAAYSHICDSVEPVVNCIGIGDVIAVQEKSVKLKKSKKILK